MPRPHLATLSFTSLLLFSCRTGVEQYVCTENVQCQNGAETGLCEVGGICSFVDQECPSGRRYGNAAGALTNHCVEYPDGGGNAEGWFDTNFQQRIRFTIASPVGEALPEFPVLTVLREADFDHETIVALSSMRLIHNDSVVPVQFEIADQNRGIEVGFWFKADLPETEELEYFIYFDPKQPIEAGPEGDVWSAYSAVYQMNAPDGLLPDASLQANDGTKVQGETVLGQVGNAIGTDQDGVVATVPDSESLQPTGCLSLSAWVQPSQSDAVIRELVSKSATPSTDGGFRLRYQDRLLASPSATITLQGGVEVTVPTEEATPLQVGEWAWLGFYVGDRLQLFIDGEPVGPSVPRTTAIAPPNAGDLQIGRDLRGDLDDVRISLQCHSPARLQADYLAVQTPLPQLGFVEAL